MKNTPESRIGVFENLRANVKQTGTTIVLLSMVCMPKEPNTRYMDHIHGRFEIKIDIY